MKRLTRFVLAGLAAVVAIGAGGALVVLRLGRPLFYSDGSTLIRADGLADRPMQVFDRPLVQFDLPGPVRGRVEYLSDGRVLYGRAIDESATSLVTFDPSRPDLEPVALGIDADGHDFSPWLMSNGDLLFTSDRDGGVGGFDLWRARSLGDGRFASPMPLDERINTLADEVDPTLAPTRDHLVFVRRSPDARETSLWQAALEGGVQASRLFVTRANSRLGELSTILDREPAFSGDGTYLWFLRERAGQAPRLLGAAWHVDHFDEPLAEFELERGVVVHGPRPLGEDLALVRDGSPVQTLRAHARLVRPWWEGQAALERVLAWVLLAALVLLTLLLLGLRWRALDIVTWCLLGSLLVHLLLWWFLRDVLLPEAEPASGGDGERMSITMLDPAAAEAAADGVGGDRVAQATTAQRSREDLATATTAPGSDLARASTPERTTAIDLPRATPTIAAVEVDTQTPRLADAAAAIVPSAIDETIPAAAAALPTPASATATPVHASERSLVAVSTLMDPSSATAPSANSALAAAAGHREAVAVELPRTTPRSRTVAPVGVAVEDQVAGTADVPPREDPRLSARTAAVDTLVGSAPREASHRAEPKSGRASDASATRLEAPQAPASSLDFAKPKRSPSSAAASELPRAVPTIAAANHTLPVVALRDENAKVAQPVRSVDQGELSQSLASLAPQQSPSRSVDRTSPTRVAAESVGSADSAPVEAARPPEASLLAPVRRSTPKPAIVAQERPAVPLYGNRFGPNKAVAIERFGGTAETERAVASGLRYLAQIQHRDGHWGRQRVTSEKYGEVYVGKTGLCLLAFLGAGHTHRGNTEYQDQVRRALDALLSAQDQATGHFGDTSAYSHGIATYALAECLAITSDKALRAPLEKAVAWILNNQNDTRDRRSRGGWGYFSATRRPEDPYARTSTTVWQVMALESARISGIEVRPEALAAARGFLAGMFDERLGAFLYNREPGRLASSWKTLPASTPAAVFCLLLLGEDPDDPRIVGGLRYTLDRRPRAWRDVSDERFVMRAEGHPYFWYCGSLACFLAGGESWSQWNQALKDVFLPAQREDGSFAPIGAYARYADDRDDHAAFTTAMAVLSLEVYYRYTTPLLEPR
ncbi:MAG: hypothetical protein AB7I19_08635 [Planctomycetota bacterium]